MLGLKHQNNQECCTGSKFCRQKAKLIEIIEPAKNCKCLTIKNSEHIVSSNSSDDRNILKVN